MSFLGRASLGSRQVSKFSNFKLMIVLPTAMAVARSKIWTCVAVAAVAPPFPVQDIKGRPFGWRCWCRSLGIGATAPTLPCAGHQDLATSPRLLAAAARESATDHNLWAAWENQEAA